MKQTIKEHIVFKTIALLLAIALLTPTIKRFNHLFTNHKHDICKGEKSTHLHEINADCDFYKFQLNNNAAILSNFDFKIAKITPVSELSYKLYNFKYLYQHLSFSLRAPPALN